MPNLSTVALAADVVNAADLVIRLAIPGDVEDELHHLGWIRANECRPLGADVSQPSCTPSIHGAMPTSRCACRDALRHAADMIVVLAEESRHVALEDEASTTRPSDPNGDANAT